MNGVRKVGWIIREGKTGSKSDDKSLVKAADGRALPAALNQLGQEHTSIAGCQHRIGAWLAMSIPAQVLLWPQTSTPGGSN